MKKQLLIITILLVTFLGAKAQNDRTRYVYYADSAMNNHLSATPMPYVAVRGWWSDLLNKPTTMAGMGLTDAYPLTGNPSGFLTAMTVASINTPSRTVNSNFTVSTTKQSDVRYSVVLSATNPLIAGSSTASAFLEYSINAGSSWITVSEGTQLSSVALAVAVAITSSSTQQLTAVIPANALVRIRTAITGTASASITARQQEVY